MGLVVKGLKGNGVKKFYLSFYSHMVNLRNVDLIVTLISLLMLLMYRERLQDYTF